ncbi:ABC transporter ATP-binding protein [Persicimonas caeni]|uniref:ABC transporter ATP-binding protein n=1 Tax=Persicimonas caeni TaxID=2292766 RepID=A0A4Y6PZ02_PERCE|nr:ABC transporter ATP-binding protein [Persicimonas caeni]QDG53493.1 ABC transporter ATP-binding protein [Persicimonas caeni]QED34714.1 ABC transporter ATP-binding protein [Persicimonas caeni]
MTENATNPDANASPNASEAPAVVELRGVDKVYEDGVAVQVLYDIDLTIRRGEFVAVVGQSGSGKSTLLNLIGLLDTATRGQVLLDGRDVSELDEDARSSLRLDYLGFIFQQHYLLPEFDVVANALMPLRIRGRDAERAARDRVVAMLESVGLGDHLHKRPNQLSGGQQQRVAVVRALANEPKLVLADEPTGSLDSETSEQVLGLLRDINARTGTALMMVTHDLAQAERAERIVELRDGRVLRDELT